MSSVQRLMPSVQRLPKPGDIWLHNKTQGKYFIFALTKLQLKNKIFDDLECAIYYNLDKKEKIYWTRPLHDFNDIVDDVPRFSYQEEK